MVGTRLVSRILTPCAFVLGLAIFTTPALAQTGQIKGKVVDADNKPVEGAKVSLQQRDTNEKFDLKTNKKGEYMQIGVPPGDYSVTVEKDGLTSTKRAHVSLDMATLDFTLKKGGDTAEMSKEDRAKADAKVQMKTTEANTAAGNKTAAARDKASQQVAEARKDATVEKRDAEYAVAKEKCDALSGGAKDVCVSEAKARYGKS